MRRKLGIVVLFAIVAGLGFTLLVWAFREQLLRRGNNPMPVFTSPDHSNGAEAAIPSKSTDSVRLSSSPFRDRVAESRMFRVRDLVTARPVAGASVFADAAGVNMCSERSTDESGWGVAVLPSECAPPCEIYVAIPQEFGGGMLKATFPKLPDRDILVPLFARLLVQTSSPEIPAAESVDDLQFGSLWCVSWPAPQDVFKEAIAESALSQLRSMYGTMPTIDSMSATTDRAVRYHESMRGIPGCNASKLVCLRKQVLLGSEHSFDIPYFGEVLISQYLPSFDWNVKVRAQAVPGETRRVVLDKLDGRRLRIIVHDTQGAAVSGARVAVVTRWDLGPEAPQPDNTFFVFTPEGSDRRIAVRRRFMVTDHKGEVAIWMLGNGPGEVYASATKSGHVGKGMDLWSGVGVPREGSFKIELRRADPEWALLTREGRPLSNCKTVKVTDLDPVSLLGQVDYPVFSTDDSGKVSLEQLVPGHRYGIIAEASDGLYQTEIIWRPGMTVAF